MVCCVYFSSDVSLCFCCLFLGAFGGAVLLGAAIVFGRRNAGWSMSQTIMQARVIAQGACVAGLVGVGVYTSIEHRSQKRDREARAPPTS